MEANIVKGSLLFVGTISLFFGIVGIVLPLLPTTPFLLLTAGCYMRASKKCYTWLINNRWIGSYIKNYQEGNGISLNGKIITLILLWSTILLSAFLMLSNFFIQLLLMIIAICVTMHIVTIKTYRRRDEKSAL